LKQYALFPSQTTREGYLKGSNTFESSTVAKARLDKHGVPIRTGKKQRAPCTFRNVNCVAHAGVNVPNRREGSRLAYRVADAVHRQG
jgi:hypothetical protein